MRCCHSIDRTKIRLTSMPRSSALGFFFSTFSPSASCPVDDRFLCAAGDFGSVVAAVAVERMEILPAPLGDAGVAEAVDFRGGIAKRSGYGVL